MNFLEEIISYKKKQLKQKAVSLEDLRKNADNIKRVSQNKFKKALLKPGISLIAEIKMASPSKGDISGYSVEKLASIYEKCNVDSISVLTEDKYFKGSLDNISKVKKIYGGPVLMKDFIVSEYQIYEGLIAGADAVLLIASVLSKKMLEKLLSICHDTGITALVEIHSRNDLKKCERLNNIEVIGINSRDLNTFMMNNKIIDEIIENIDKDLIKVAESGIDSAGRVKQLYNLGYDAVLIGESIISSADPEKKIMELKRYDST